MGLTAEPPFSDQEVSTLYVPVYSFIAFSKRLVDPIVSTDPLGSFLKTVATTQASAPTSLFLKSHCHFRDVSTTTFRALITSTQILSTPGTFLLWRSMRWPLPKRWARTLLLILKRECQVLDMVKAFLPLSDNISSTISVIYLLVLRNMWSVFQRNVCLNFLE